MISPGSAINQKELLTLAKNLVRTPSVLGNEAAVAELVRLEFLRLGYDRVEVDEAGNVVGIIEAPLDGPTVLLDAHMDTVDIVPAGAWRKDPFGAEIRGGRLYGRGSSDMKGALAAMIHAAAAAGRDLPGGRVVVSASVGEESIEGAALELVLGRYPADYVVIGEASELNLVRAGRGRAEFLIETQGKPSHASTPHLGINAITRMFELFDHLRQLTLPVDNFVGKGILCITDIISEPYPAHSVVPSGCRATCERRTVPGETPEAVKAALEDACRQSAGTGASVRLAESRLTTYTGYTFQREKWLSPWVIPEDHFLVQAALTGLQRSGLNPRLTSYQFCTNAAYSAGVAEIPTIGFGPSRESLAHTIDEHVEVEEILSAARGYLGIIRALTNSR